ncbi:MAG: cytochrome P450 [Pseudopedobacter sp.]|nr:cytochrome P450 [Deinococcales bacterium]
MTSARPTPSLCPVDPPNSPRKTQAQPEAAEPRVSIDAHGVWFIRGFEECRQILRGDATRQAGFSAERLDAAAGRMREPILYLEGERHRQLRSQTAKFFTPSATKKQHQAVMESLTEHLIERLEKSGRADLSQLSLELAVGVAAHVIGLSGSPIKGLARRIGALAHNPSHLSSGQKRIQALMSPLHLLAFYWFDVRPAMNARRKNQRDDVVSHVMKLGYKAHEVLAECVTYGAAGMLTTREFISITTWHLLERPELRARYLVAAEAERHAILGEILRLEPVIGSLKRRATAPITLKVDGTEFFIPVGALMHLSIYCANADSATVGENPHDLCPGRPLPRGVQEPVLGFGDGHHRCPGSFLAFAETDVFLLRLLALPVTLESRPILSFNPVLEGYEIRNVQLRLEH